MPVFPVSSVPAVLIYLQTTITNAVDEPGTEITFGEADSMNQTDNYIEIGSDIRRPLDHLEQVGSGGAGYLNENYEVDITTTCWVGSGTDAAATAIQTAWALEAVVETAVRQDLTMGGNIMEGLPVGTKGGFPTWSDDPQGLMVEITFTVRCFNRI